MHLKAKTLDDLLNSTFAMLLKSQQSINATRGEAREETGVLLELSNPRARLSRTEMKGKPFSCLGELLWYLSGSNGLPFINYYLKAYEADSVDGHTVYGGYGPRLFDSHGNNQIKNTLDLLRNNPGSRRAVIQIFDSADISHRRLEVPCTCTLQFMVRNGQLNMFVTMRSNDAYLGLPHDVFAFTMIQEIFCKSLDTRLGTYKHFVGSLHLYDEHVSGAETYLSEGLQPTDIRMPAMPRGTPWPSIKSLLEFERKIREEVPVQISEYNFKPYWADLARLLQIFKSSKQNDRLEMDRIQKEMSSNVYQTYIEMRKSTQLRVNADQGQLELAWT